jgi:hypothetical protein
MHGYRYRTTYILDNDIHSYLWGVVANATNLLMTNEDGFKLQILPDLQGEFSSELCSFYLLYVLNTIRIAQDTKCICCGMR